MFGQLFNKRFGRFFGQTTRCTLCLRPTEQEVIPPEQLVQGHYVCTTCQQSLTPEEILQGLRALGLVAFVAPAITNVIPQAFNKLLMSGMVARFYREALTLAGRMTDALPIYTIHELQTGVNVSDHNGGDQSYHVLIVPSIGLQISYKDGYYYRGLQEGGEPSSAMNNDIAIGLLDLNLAYGDDNTTINVQYNPTLISSFGRHTFHERLQIREGLLIADDVRTQLPIEQVIFQSKDSGNILNITYIDIRTFITITFDTTRRNGAGLYQLKTYSAGHNRSYTLEIIYNEFLY